MDSLRLLVLVPVALLFGLTGLLLLLTPPRVILKWDRKTGYWLAKKAASPERGALIAGIFYKILGAAFLAVVVLEVVPSIFR